jgi:hypothetical protein
MRLFIALLLCLSTAAPANAEQPLPGYAWMKLFFCAYGSVGWQPIHPPPGFENEFAVAVVEVNNERALPNAPAPDVTLLYQDGKTIGTKRVVSVEVFDEPFVPGEGSMGFYLATRRGGHTHPWNGTLPTGMVHLRVRVALAAQNGVPPPQLCRVRLGPYTVEGPWDGIWAT